MLKNCRYTVHLVQRSGCTSRSNSKGCAVVKCFILCIQNNADAMSHKLGLRVSKIMQLKQKCFQFDFETYLEHLVFITSIFFFFFNIGAVPGTLFIYFVISVTIQYIHYSSSGCSPAGYSFFLSWVNDSCIWANSFLPAESSI